MNDYITDLTFGINNQAMAVLHFLAKRTPEFADYKGGFYSIQLETKPWYNGREKGFVVSMAPDYVVGKWVHIAIFEHRNSDEIHALKWITDRNYWNHPLEDPNIFDIAYGGEGKNKYDTAMKFGYGEVGKCADWVYDELSAFYGDCKVKVEQEKGE